MRKMLFQKKCLPLATIILTAVLLSLGCKSKNQNSPQGYAFGEPHRIELGKALNEISGICYNEADSNLLVVSDSKEKVYQIDFKTKKLRDYTEKVVLSGSDLEDIVKIDTSLFLLMSKGILIEVPDKAKDTSSIKTYQLHLSGSNDFETVYFDPSADGLVLLCKTCAHEQGKGIRTAFRFDLRSRTFDSTMFFTISRQQVKNLVKNDDADFKPSAAAIHPINKRLYILSSAGNLLVVADTSGPVAEARSVRLECERDRKADEAQAKLRQQMDDREMEEAAETFYRQVDALVAQVLRGAGYHRHNRGSWRKKRGGSEHG
jgi:hypothetical protein